MLLHGETGTGKTLAARALHQASARAAQPLVEVDVSGIQAAHLEAELFGQARGSSGHSARSGLIEAAQGGSLLLREVADLPLGVQAQLLRLLDSGTYQRVGSHELRRADVRLLATTRHDLPVLLRQGQLRADWYYALSTFPIALPALRERLGDLPLLAQALLQRLAPGRHLALARRRCAHWHNTPLRATCVSCATCWRAPPCSPMGAASAPSRAARPGAGATPPAPADGAAPRPLRT